MDPMFYPLPAQGPFCGYQAAYPSTYYHQYHPDAYYAALQQQQLQTAYQASLLNKQHPTDESTKKPIKKPAKKSTKTSTNKSAKEQAEQKVESKEQCRQAAIQLAKKYYVTTGSLASLPKHADIAKCCHEKCPVPEINRGGLGHPRGHSQDHNTQKGRRNGESSFVPSAFGKSSRQTRHASNQAQTWVQSTTCLYLQGRRYLVPWRQRLTLQTNMDPAKSHLQDPYLTASTLRRPMCNSAKSTF